MIMMSFNLDVFISYKNNLTFDKFYVKLFLYFVIFVPITLNLFSLYLINFKEKRNFLPKNLSTIFPTFCSDFEQMLENKEVLAYYKKRGYREILLY